VNHGQTWKGGERSGEKGLIISDNQAQTCLIITINDTSTGDLPLIITISDTCKNQPKRLDLDNTINLSSLVVSLEVSKLRTERALVSQRRSAPQFVEGDLVLLSTRYLRLKYPHAKLLPKFVGPFEVFQQPENSHKNPNSVWLKTPNTLHIHMLINTKDVRRYIARSQHLGGAPDIEVPLPVTVDGYDKKTRSGMVS
jgi:hypothetical protein